MKTGNTCALYLLAMLCFISCNRDVSDVDVSGITVDAKARRFEQDLFKSFKSGSDDQLNQLRNRYGSFVDVFTHRMLNIPEGSDTFISTQLRQFVDDAEVNDIYRLTDSAYKSISDVEAGMEVFLKHLKFYYPAKAVPGIVTYISAFNYAVITTDSVIGIGLDMFLGSGSEYYPRLGIPKYMFQKFSREYIVPSAVKAWYQSEYDPQSVKKELLSQLLYQGKLIWFGKCMVPGLHDTLLTGYTAEQLKWCSENEANVWSFFIENKLLFNTDPSVFAKYTSEGPTTSGFPKEAPGNTGAWMGYRIVKKYAEKNSGLSLADLMNENDSQKILEASGYKPQKN